LALTGALVWKPEMTGLPVAVSPVVVGDGGIVLVLAGAPASPAEGGAVVVASGAVVVVAAGA
jgi:hypothetical protein